MVLQNTFFEMHLFCTKPFFHWCWYCWVFSMLDRNFYTVDCSEVFVHLTYVIASPSSLLLVLKKIYNYDHIWIFLYISWLMVNCAKFLGGIHIYVFICGSKHVRYFVSYICCSIYAFLFKLFFPATEKSKYYIFFNQIFNALIMLCSQSSINEYKACACVP